MIDYINQAFFLSGSIHKELEILTDDGEVTITNEDLHQEKFELRETLCSETSLIFGSCEASSVKFTVSNIFGSLKGKWITVTMVINHDRDNPLQIGRYKVDSDVPTANRDNRDVTAYDATHDILCVDVRDWYDTVLPTESSTVTLREFRDSFFRYFGIEQEDIELPNDNMIVAKTIQPEELSGKTVLVAICEINGCFGNIGRNGKFRYVFLQQRIEGLYPSQTLHPSDTLFPREPRGTFISNGTYIPPCKYESYKVQSISGLLIRKEENDLGVQVGTKDNLYIIQDNFLVYGKGTEDLTVVANNIFGCIKDIVYRPFNTKANGNPCLEIGDPIRLSTKNDRIETYILSRTLTGIQALKDEYTAEGSEFRESSVNTIRQSIIELKNKSNTLTRTLEETKSEIVDMERGLTSTITQTANKISADIENLSTQTNTNLSVLDGRITAEVNRAENAEANLQVTANEIKTSVSNLAESTSSRFSQTDSAISAEVKRAGDAEAALQVSINGITSSVSDLETSTTSRFNQTNSLISAEITRAQDAEASLQASVEGIGTSVSNLANQTSSQIQQLSSSISLKVSRGSIISEINQSAEEVTIDAGKINLNGYVSAGSGNFSIDENGNMVLRSGEYRISMSGGGLIFRGPVPSCGTLITPGSIFFSYSNGSSTYNYLFADINQYSDTFDDYGIDMMLGPDGNLQTARINGSTPITAANISSYLEDTETTLNRSTTKVSYTSVGNINIMSTSGYQAESGYKYGNIASTGWVQGKVAGLNSSISDLRTELRDEMSSDYSYLLEIINDHEERLRKLE